MDAQELRRLLELAAKAAGVEIEWNVMINHHSPILAPKTQQERNWLGHEHTLWNPLSDDGDALRLSVRLRLSVDHNHTADQQRWVSADRNGCEGCYSPVSCVEDEFDEQDRSAATRLAIVRAAAAIGEKMGEEK